MKAAFVTPGAFPVPSAMGGSVERVVEKVVPRLAPELDVVIYSRTGTGLTSRGELNYVPIERFPAVSKEKYFASVCRRLQRFRPNIIQVENRPKWVPRLKRRFPGCRVWLNLHSTTFISGSKLRKKERGRCLRAADRIFVNSDYLKSYILRNVPNTGMKIHVNHLGVEAFRFPGHSTFEGQALRAIGRVERGWVGRKIALFVGRLVPQKGVHHLLAAVPEIVAKHPDALIVIVGSALYGSHRTTRYARSLHRQAKAWRHHVHFQPYVSHNEIPRWFAMADLAVVPSIGNEAFGLVNVEAMAAELPVVATTAGGMKEIVLDGVTGFLVTKERPGIVRGLAERISELFGNEDMRYEMGERGRERVMNRFLWEHTAQRWLQLTRE
ncbi:glycosyltransferase family 4 protein [Cohnella yongneupensis]|uniref:Glycosyltransferase family 4 protein n=1 Tax=Cohnella yongneupensis TaxID=425006 RepID=A0ABW0QU71_9BACL